MLDAVLDALPSAPSESFEEIEGVVRAGSRSSASPTSASPACSTGSPARIARLSNSRWPARPSTPSTKLELGDEDVALHRHRRHSTAVYDASGAEYFASLRTATALERAEVAVVLIDASQPLAEQDLRIISMVEEAGRALVIAYNKWDLVDEDRRYELEREIDRQLVRVTWAPRVNVSAQTGRHVDRLVPALETALASWDGRVGTGRLNAFLGQLVAATPPPVRGGKQPKIMFATQASTRPPRFVLFTTGFLEAGYRRFIERRLREEFGFEGTPIEVSVRMRERRSAS